VAAHQLLLVQLDVAAAQKVLCVVVEAAWVRQRYAEVVVAISRFSVVRRRDGEVISGDAVHFRLPREGSRGSRTTVRVVVLVDARRLYFQARSVVDVGELTADSCLTWLVACVETKVCMSAIYDYEASTGHEVYRL